LLELAFGIFIVGMMMSGALGLTQYIKAQKVSSTQQKIENITRVLSAYAQTHYRLPCPADPTETNPAKIGREGLDGKCLDTSSTSSMYWKTEGVVPWKELGIPQEMVVDAWNRYITYKPAPNLTVDTSADTMQDKAGTDTPAQDIHNACRSPMWFDTKGNHVNRAKALFCCSAQPRTAYLTAVGATTTMPAKWRNMAVTDTQTASGMGTQAANAEFATDKPVMATGAWADDVSKIPDNYGTFLIPHYQDDRAAAPLARAVTPAVVLISHGANGSLAFKQETGTASARMGGTITQNTASTASTVALTEQGNVWPPQVFAAVLGHPKRNGYNALSSGNGSFSDDIVSYVRSDQLFAKVGGASCQYPPSVWFQPYSCTPQTFTGPTGSAGVDASYGLQLALTPGQKYQMRSSFTKKPDEAGYKNSLGYYFIADDGTIKNVTLVSQNLHDLDNGDQAVSSIGVDPSTQSGHIGVFMIPDGGGKNNFANLNVDHYEFLNASGQPAKSTDTTPPLLYAVDAQGAKTLIKSADNNAAYHMNGNLNPGQVSHMMTTDNVCTGVGATVGVNHDVTCVHKSTIQNPGIDASNPAMMNVGFEDLALSNNGCYEMKAGAPGYPCAKWDSPEAQVLANRVKSPTGGYVAQMGDNDFDDATFNYSVTACPEGSPGT
jgi:hypothetical protein